MGSSGSGDAQPPVVLEEVVPVALDWVSDLPRPRTPRPHELSYAPATNRPSILQERSYPLITPCDGSTRIRIICDPDLQRRLQKRKMGFCTCFDLIELPRPCRSNWKFILRFLPAEGASTIVVERECLGTGGTPGEAVVPGRRPTLTFPCITTRGTTAVSLTQRPMTKAVAYALRKRVR